MDPTSFVVSVSALLVAIYAAFRTFANRLRLAAVLKVLQDRLEE